MPGITSLLTSPQLWPGPSHQHTCPTQMCFSCPPDLLDRLLIPLRLCTLMRASEISSIPWALFHMNNQGNWEPHQPLFLHTNSKSGTRKTYSIMGKTAITVIHYTWLHINVPGTFFIRTTDQPQKNVGSERNPKRCLNILKKMVIYTERGIQKPQLERGHSNPTGPKCSIPALDPGRGGWTYMDTLQKHYNSLHQTQNWETLLPSGGKPSGNLWLMQHKSVLQSL